MDQTSSVKIAKQLLPDVLDWLGPNESDSDPEDVERDLVKAIEGGYYRQYDGFCIAAELEDAGWEPNAELVRILDRAGRIAAEGK